jgi:hypothetical protein
MVGGHIEPGEGVRAGAWSEVGEATAASDGLAVFAALVLVLITAELEKPSWNILNPTNARPATTAKPKNEARIMEQVFIQGGKTAPSPEAGV